MNNISALSKYIDRYVCIYLYTSSDIKKKNYKYINT